MGPQLEPVVGRLARVVRVISRHCAPCLRQPVRKAELIGGRDDQRLAAFECLFRLKPCGNAVVLGCRAGNLVKPQAVSAVQFKRFPLHAVHEIILAKHYACAELFSRYCVAVLILTFHYGPDCLRIFKGVPLPVSRHCKAVYLYAPLNAAVTVCDRCGCRI